MFLSVPLKDSTGLSQRRLDSSKQDTHEVVLSHQERLSLLESVYTAYRAVDVTNYFWMEHWVVLLEDCQLIGTHTGALVTPLDCFASIS